MSARAIRFEWERLVLSDGGPPSPTTRHVLLTLATHADPQGVAWPSIKKLMSETRLSNRAVIEHLHNAETAGWIKRSATREGKGWRHSVYTLTVPNSVHSGGDPRSSAPRGADTRSPACGKVAGDGDPSAQDGDPGAKRGDPGDIHVVTVRHTNNEVINMPLNIKNIIARIPIANTEKVEHGSNVAIAAEAAELPPTKAVSKGRTIENWGASRGLTADPGESKESYMRRLSNEYVKQCKPA